MTDNNNSDTPDAPSDGDIGEGADNTRSLSDELRHLATDAFWAHNPRVSANLERFADRAEELEAKAERLDDELSDETANRDGWEDRLTSVVYSLASVEEVGEWSSGNELDQTFVDHMQGKIQGLERQRDEALAEVARLTCDPEASHGEEGRPITDDRRGHWNSSTLIGYLQCAESDDLVEQQYAACNAPDPKILAGWVLDLLDPPGHTKSSDDAADTREATGRDFEMVVPEGSLHRHEFQDASGRWGPLTEWAAGPVDTRNWNVVPTRVVIRRDPDKEFGTANRQHPKGSSMSTIDRAAHAIDCARQGYSSVAIDTGPEAFAEMIAQALAEAGLLVPDLPEPDETEGIITFGDEPNIYATPEGQVNVLNARGEWQRAKPAYLRALAAPYLAAANYSKEQG